MISNACSETLLSAEIRVILQPSPLAKDPVCVCERPGQHSRPHPGRSHTRITTESRQSRNYSVCTAQPLASRTLRRGGVGEGPELSCA